MYYYKGDTIQCGKTVRHRYQKILGWNVNLIFRYYRSEGEAKRRKKEEQFSKKKKSDLVNWKIAIRIIPKWFSLNES